MAAPAAGTLGPHACGCVWENCSTSETACAVVGASVATCGTAVLLPLPGCGAGASSASACFGGRRPDGGERGGAQHLGPQLGCADGHHLRGTVELRKACAPPDSMPKVRVRVGREACNLRCLTISQRWRPLACQRAMASPSRQVGCGRPSGASATPKRRPDCALAASEGAPGWCPRDAQRRLDGARAVRQWRLDNAQRRPGGAPTAPNHRHTRLALSS